MYASLFHTACFRCAPCTNITQNCETLIPPKVVVVYSITSTSAIHTYGFRLWRKQKRLSSVSSLFFFFHFFFILFCAPLYNCKQMWCVYSPLWSRKLEVWQRSERSRLSYGVRNASWTGVFTVLGMSRTCRGSSSNRFDFTELLILSSTKVRWLLRSCAKIWERCDVTLRRKSAAFVDVLFKALKAHQFTFILSKGWTPWSGLCGE